MPIEHKPYTKILVDGGDPEETKRIEALLGFKVDGQTTNPSLIAKNPEIMALVKSGHRLSKAEEDAEYKKIVQSISPLVGDAGVSIEVFADMDTTAEQMIVEALEKNSWIPNAYIKLPTTKAGLQAGEKLTAQGLRLNFTLCFTQEQAAAVYAATKGAKSSAYVSPFIGRLDDIGQNGMDLIRNIKEMFKTGDGHVEVLSASVRSMDHLMAIFSYKSDLATVPTPILEKWQTAGFPMPDENYIYPAGVLKAIEYKEISLDQSWNSYDLHSDLTDQGIAKFVADYKATLMGSGTGV
jgi:transaldolase